MSEEKQSNKLWLALGLGCGIPLGLIVLLFFGAIAYFATGPEGGVRLTNTMEDYALEYIEEHDLLAEGEKVIAYYDVTVGLSGSEAAILTDSRLIYHKSGRNSEMALADVETIETDGDGMGGDVIRVLSKNGDAMVIEIAVFNQGELFIKALEDKVAAVQTPAQPAK
jgi:hypothetical protein